MNWMVVKAAARQKWATESDPATPAGSEILAQKRATEALFQEASTIALIAYIVQS
jgi:hypothetical protein